MKTIEITDNVKEVIIKYRDNTEKLINNEEIIYVPKCIGLYNKKTLLFNNNKSCIYATNGLYDVLTDENTRTNKNNGKNFKLIKCMFNEVEIGEIFVDAYSIDSRDKLLNYDIKISEDKTVYIDDIDLYTLTMSNPKVYKVVKI